jgi:hypothetical protein
MCLPVSRLFWVSSLAYPNLLRTKGYVVVVVVVVEEVAVFTSMNISLKIIVGLFNTPSIPNYMSF